VFSAAADEAPSLHRLELLRQGRNLLPQIGNFKLFFG
jgi:hypothetical protein